MSLCIGLFHRWKKSAVAFVATFSLASCAFAGANLLAEHDHMELDASLVAPYNGEGNSDARTFTLRFAYPANAMQQAAHWRLQLRDPAGALVQEWAGKSVLADGVLDVNIAWAGRVGVAARLPDGIYRASLAAFAVEAKVSGRAPENIFPDQATPLDDFDVIEQAWDIRVGNPPAPAMPAFRALPTAASNTAARQSSKGRSEAAIARAAPATGSLPYTVYFGNLHSQTNHSDGGGVIGSCTSSQPAQTGAFGPADAFPYAKNAGLDILMTSEHNHYFDGSSGTNASAVPATVKALYQSGLAAATNFNAANPNFLAVYGLEWGVISNGGHMNIFNTNELLGWELNGSGQLLADTLTPKSDYAGIYALMKQRGWVGQFNHPDTVSQFQIAGTSLAYSADGDEVMVLAEVLNSSAFSANITETETGRSSFEGAFNILLERGYHVAPASNQDNHCANWGASYTNRTGILIANGTALSTTSFIDAIKARRVYATMDKNSQLILTANGHVMGERITNGGALALTANFANTAGRSVSTVNIFEGVPGRNGTVTALTATATATVTPAVGSHFYYAKVTQDDGKILWSAPIWVDQVAGGDTTAPTVSAAVTGNSGSITFTASATDNVGVSNVEFLVDGVLKGSDATAPYSLTFNSATIANGAHTLTAKAYDAAGNIGTSAAVNFSVNNTVADTIAPTVSATASGSSGTITFAATASDNVGVTNVEFLVDGAVKGSAASAPYALAFDSTTVANGTHTLTARASDAAGNVGTSAAVSFSVNNVVGTTFNEVESNGSTGLANVVGRTVTSIIGTMGNTTDKDYFAIALNANERLTLSMTGPSTTDYDLYVVDAVDTTLASSTGSTSTESIVFTNGATARTVYVKVISFSGSSTTQPYTITLSYAAAPTQLIANSGFESGNVSWTASAGVITNSTGQTAHGGTWKAWLNGYGSAHTDTLTQDVTIPASATTASLSFWLKVTSSETSTTQALDTLKVQLRSTANAVLTTLATYSNLNKGSAYVQRSFDITAYKGQTVRLYFEGIEGSSVATSFVIDDVTVNTQ